jgi:hypothetical protein
MPSARAFIASPCAISLGQWSRRFSLTGIRPGRARGRHGPSIPSDRTHPGARQRRQRRSAARPNRQGPQPAAPAEAQARRPRNPLEAARAFKPLQLGRASVLETSAHGGREPKRKKPALGRLRTRSLSSNILGVGCPGIKKHRAGEEIRTLDVNPGEGELPRNGPPLTSTRRGPSRRLANPTPFVLVRTPRARPSGLGCRRVW